MAVCRDCKHFNFHLPRNSTIGFCSEWVQCALPLETCQRFKECFQINCIDPLSINGKTMPEYIALTTGKCWATGNILTYDRVKSLAIKYSVQDAFIPFLEDLRQMKVKNDELQRIKKLKQLQTTLKI